MSESAGILNGVLQYAGDSILLIFFVLLAAAAIPLYKVWSKEKKTQKQYEQECKQQLLDVIKENSSVIAELKTTIELNGSDMKQSQARIHERIDGTHERLNSVHERLNDLFVLCSKDKGGGD